MPVKKFCPECGIVTDHLVTLSCLGPDHSKTPRSKRYRISNRVTGAWGETDALSAQEACEKLGWMIGDCFVLASWHH